MGSWKIQALEHSWVLWMCGPCWWLSCRASLQVGFLPPRAQHSYCKRLHSGCCGNNAASCNMFCNVLCLSRACCCHIPISSVLDHLPGVPVSMLPYPSCSIYACPEAEYVLRAFIIFIPRSSCSSCWGLTRSQHCFTSPTQQRSLMCVLSPHSSTSSITPPPHAALPTAATSMNSQHTGCSHCCRSCSCPSCCIHHLHPVLCFSTHPHPCPPHTQAHPTQCQQSSWKLTGQRCVSALL